MTESASVNNNWEEEGTKIPSDYTEVHADLDESDKSGESSSGITFTLLFLIPIVAFSVWCFMTHHYSWLIAPGIAVVVLLILTLHGEGEIHKMHYATWIFKNITPEKTKGRVTTTLAYSNEHGRWNEYILNLPGRIPEQYDCFAVSKNDVKQEPVTQISEFRNEDIELTVYFDPVNKLAVVAEAPNGFRLWLRPRPPAYEA